MKKLKFWALIILGLVVLTGLVATTFAVYSYAVPNQKHSGDEEYGEMYGGHYGMHDNWEEMHDGCMEMMDEVYEKEHNSTTHYEAEESHHHHHGCP